LRIALEASNIGQGCLDPSSRTGIYRVATSLAEILLKKKDIELFFAFLSLPHTAEITRNFFKENGYSIQYFCENSKVEKKLYKLMIDTPRFKHKYGMMLYTALALQSLKKKKFLDSIDIFHSIYFPLPDNISPVTQVRIITIHDIIAILHPELCKSIHSKRVHNVIKSINKKHDWIIAVSQSTKKYLCDYARIPEERIFVTHLAASPDLYYPEKDAERIKTITQKLNVPNRNYFLTLATLEPRKNIEFVVRCFKKIITEPGFNNTSLVLAGSKGWKIKELYKSVLTDPVLKKHVIFTGYIPDKYLNALYSGALAFIYPSLYEGFGLPPLEAMQCGTPVITSNINSLLEVVGDAGIMVDPNYEDALCQAMIDIVQINTLRHDLSQKGLERSALFSWDKCADKTIQAYRYALDNKKQ
jgi:glycosyltransferase involved in cell wall biosynthesis